MLINKSKPCLPGQETGMTISTLLLICLAAGLLGSMVFFAAAVAPTVFRILPAEHAGKFLRAFFPIYYVWGFVLAAAIAAIAFTTSTTVGILAVIIALLFAASRQLLMPRINLARDEKLAGDQDADARFKRLHMFSVLINLLQMLLLIGMVVVLMIET
jgi:hypothetical protein